MRYIYVILMSFSILSCYSSSPGRLVEMKRGDMCVKEGLFLASFSKKELIIKKKSVRLSRGRTSYLFKLSEGDFNLLEKHLESNGYSKFKQPFLGQDLGYKQFDPAVDPNNKHSFSSWWITQRRRYDVCYEHKKKKLILVSSFTGDLNDGEFVKWLYEADHEWKRERGLKFE